MGINYYALWLWSTLSPIGLSITILSIFFFLIAYWRIWQYDFIRRTFEKARDFETSRAYNVYIDDDQGPVLVKTVDRSWFWFGIMLACAAWILLLVAFPMSCTFSGLGQTWICS